MSTEQQPLVNRVAQSGLITLKLEDDYPQEEFYTFDLADYLFKGLILKEKDFREALKQHTWTQYQDGILLVYCSTDAIIPVWAYMLVAAYATPVTKSVFQGQKEAYLVQHYSRIIDNIDTNPYIDARLVIKGCSDLPVPLSAYVDLTEKLRPVARSIMFGEPCSTVPIYKRPRKKV
ncbi:MAG: DUF2480 family protein [Saprospiraceae bacterium]|nr:DUF2480 family protein [Saprospiraceae bacterium]